MDRLSRVCEACGEGTVRTICNECREFYCQTCYDYHLRFKATRDHHLIDLHPKYGDPQKETTESGDEAELSSDFVEHLTVTENTVLYRAQVAVERTINPKVGLERGVIPKRDGNQGTKKGPSSTQDETANPDEGTARKDKTLSSARLVKDSKIGQFSINRPDDEKNAVVGAILVLTENIIVADCPNKKLKLFDLSGVYLSSVDSEHHVLGITAVTGNCFATCGTHEQVRLWTLRGKAMVSEDISYDVDHDSHGIDYNGTYFCVLHLPDNAITVLDTQGRQVRKIVRKKAHGKGIRFGFDIHIDRNINNIYVVCYGDVNAVLCLSLEDEALWFTPLKACLGGITEIDGVLCVTDYDEGHCVHMVSKSGEYKGKLLDKDVLEEREPFYMCYVEDAKKIYFSLYNSNIICFMSL